MPPMNDPTQPARGPLQPMREPKQWARNVMQKVHHPDRLIGYLHQAVEGRARSVDDSSKKKPDSMRTLANPIQSAGGP